MHCNNCFSSTTSAAYQLTCIIILFPSSILLIITSRCGGSTLEPTDCKIKFIITIFSHVALRKAPSPPLSRPCSCLVQIIYYMLFTIVYKKPKPHGIGSRGSVTAVKHIKSIVEIKWNKFSYNYLLSALPSRNQCMMVMMMTMKQES